MVCRLASRALFLTRPPLVFQIKWLVEYINLKGNECAKVASLDDSISILLNDLVRAGEENRTLVVYTTDHGWTDKGHAYQGSSHVPLVMRWPGVIRPGTVVADLVSHVDLPATLYDVALSTGAAANAAAVALSTGAAFFADRARPNASPPSMDGRSVAHVFARAEQPLGVPAAPLGHRDAVFIENGWNRAVVTGRFKYLRTYFPRALNMPFAREHGGVRIRPYFGLGCGEWPSSAGSRVLTPHSSSPTVHDWWATSCVKHGAYFYLRQLYNLRKDPYEQTNLVDATEKQYWHAQVLAQHEERLGAHLEWTAQCAADCWPLEDQQVEHRRGIMARYLDELNNRTVEHRNYLTDWFLWTASEAGDRTT